VDEMAASAVADIQHKIPQFREFALHHITHIHTQPDLIMTPCQLHLHTENSHVITKQKNIIKIKCSITTVSNQIEEITIRDRITR
jgi:hypothetical protein